MNRFFASVAAAAILLATAANAAPVRAPAAAQSDEAAKLAEARAIVEIISPAAEREKSLNTMLPKVVAQFRPKLPPEIAADAGLTAIIDNASKDMMEQLRPVLLKHLPDMAEANAVAYTHEFSLAELKQIHAFAETPVGHHYLSRSPFLLTDPAVAKANSAMIADIQQSSEPAKAQLKDKLIAYLTAHPELAKKLQADAQGK